MQPMGKVLVMAGRVYDGIDDSRATRASGKMMRHRSHEL
jgi:hypothetical protein